MQLVERQALAFWPFADVVRSEMNRLTCFYGKDKECYKHNPTAPPCDSCQRVEEIMSILFTGKGKKARKS